MVNVSTGATAAYGTVPVAIVHLSELQTVSGSVAGDQADQILVNTDDRSVKDSLEGLYPRTTVVERSGLAAQRISTSNFPLAIAVSGAATAVFVGVLFVATLTGLAVNDDSESLGALAAIGLSRRSRSFVVAVETVTVALLGGVCGLVSALESNLTETHPQYTVRTNDQQLRATLRNQAVVLLSGASLLVLAVVAGVLLVLNMQLSFVFRHREMLAAVTALGVSRSSLAWVVLVYALFVGLLGGLLGVTLALPGIELVNAVTERVTGFENVATLPQRVLLGGFALAVLISTVGGLAASVYLARSSPLDALQ